MTVVYTHGFEQGVEKSDGACLAGSDNLFTISGGPILVTEFMGIVTTGIGDVAATCHIDFTSDVPSATTTALSTTVSIVSKAAGTSFTFDTTALSVLTVTTNGLLVLLPRIAWLLPAGTIKAHCSAANTTGVIAWYIFYKQLSQYSKVIAAA